MWSREAGELLAGSTAEVTSPAELKSTSVSVREAMTIRQLERVERALAIEFSNHPATEVHAEVVRVAEDLLDGAHFSDHVAVLTGRLVAERFHQASPAAARA